MKRWIASLLGGSLLMVFLGGCAHACVDRHRATYGSPAASGSLANWAYFDVVVR
jgi:hypothetical protein